MKKLFVLAIVFLLIFPAFAWAVEEEPLPPGEETTAPEETTPLAGRTDETTTYAIHLFDYVIVVIPGSDETPTTVGLFTADASGTAIEAIASYTVGGILGKAVSAIAQTVSPGPGHGKVVSAFVHEAIKARKEVRDQEKEEKKSEIRQRVEEKKALKGEKGKPSDEESDETSGKGKGKSREKNKRPKVKGSDEVDAENPEDD